MNRCPVCDAVDVPMVRDPFELDKVCVDCALSIQEASGITWEEKEFDEVIDEPTD